MNYSSFDPYCLGVIESSYLLVKRCEIGVVKSRDDLISGYGHFFDVDNSFCNGPAEVFWSELGIDLSFSKGHKIFIPKEMFIGGR